MLLFLRRLSAARFLKALSRPARKADSAATERAVLKVLRLAAGCQTVYGSLLRRARVAPERVRSLDEFRAKVPVVGKEDIFGTKGFLDFFSAGAFPKTATLYTSSGFTRRLAFGALSERDRRRSDFFLSEILFPLAGLTDRDFLLINCLPLGTEIPLRHCPQVKTGLRSDLVVEVLKRAADERRTIVLVGEPLFLKRAAEEGTEAGIDWERLRLHAFTGSEYVSEHWRRYLHALLRQDPAPGGGGVLLTYGLTECGLAVGFETPALRALRVKLAAEGKEAGPAPEIMHYFPGQYFLETAAGPARESELVITALDPGRLIPLVRYRTGDEASLLDPEALAGLLDRNGLSRAQPAVKSLPAIALRGRRMGAALSDGRFAHANLVKDALFRDHAVARAVTGNFRLEPAAADREARLLVQLSPSASASENTAGRLGELLGAEGLSGLAVECLLYRAFPFGFGHEYERKIQYGGREAGSDGDAER